MANKHMKICSISHVIREMQIERTMISNYTPIKMAKIWNQDIKCYQGYGETETPSLLTQVRKWNNHFAKQLGGFL